MKNIDNMSPFMHICKGMLLLNVAWDVLSTFTIWMTYCTSDVLIIHLNAQDSVEDTLLIEQGAKKQTWQGAIATMHTGLWSRKVDANNHAACMLMGWWVLTLGSMRALAVYDEERWLIVAVLSYALECSFFLMEALKSTMTPKKACPTSIFCFFCLILCVAVLH